MAKPGKLRLLSQAGRGSFRTRTIYETSSGEYHMTAISTSGSTPGQASSAAVDPTSTDPVAAANPLSNAVLSRLSQADQTSLTEIIQELCSRAGGKADPRSPLSRNRDDLLALSIANRREDAMAAHQNLIPQIIECFASNALSSQARCHLVDALGRHAVALHATDPDSQQSVISAIEKVCRLTGSKDKSIAKAAMNSILEMTKSFGRNEKIALELEPGWKKIKKIAQEGILGAIVTAVAIPKQGSLTEHARDILRRRG